MIRPHNDITSVKAQIRRFRGQPVCVHVNLGRNKSADFTGRLTGIYPALFTVLPDDANYRGKTAYSYAEILCGSVQVRPRPQHAGNCAPQKGQTEGPYAAHPIQTNRPQPNGCGRSLFRIHFQIKRGSLAERVPPSDRF